MRDAEIYRDNLRLSCELHRRGTAIEDGQLEELLREASFSHPLTAEDAAALFTDTFSCPLLSAFYGRFCALLAARGLLTRLPVEENLNTPSRIFYLQNAYTDRAFEQFSQCVFDATAHLKMDFRAVCESIDADTSDYCILPLFSTADGELPAFAKLIRTYGLALRALCSVPTADEDGFIRFGLLGRRPIWDEKTEYAMFSFIPESADLQLSALEGLCQTGAALHRINTVPLEYNIQRLEYILTVRMPPFSLAAGTVAFAKTAMLADCSSAFYILK